MQSNRASGARSGGARYAPRILSAFTRRTGHTTGAPASLSKKPVRSERRDSRPGARARKEKPRSRRSFKEAERRARSSGSRMASPLQEGAGAGVLQRLHLRAHHQPRTEEGGAGEAGGAAAAEDAPGPGGALQELAGGEEPGEVREGGVGAVRGRTHLQTQGRRPAQGSGAAPAGGGGTKWCRRRGCRSACWTLTW